MSEQQATTPDTGVDQSPEDRVMAILGRGDDAPTQEAESETPQAPPVEQAQTDELTADDLPEEQAEAPSAEGDVFEIVHNGQQHRLTREDAIRYAQQGFDYTQKTQAVAEQAKAVSERLQRLEQVEQVQQVLSADLATVKAYEAQLNQFRNVDWVKLATEEPLDYPKYRAQYDTLVQGWQAAVHQYEQKSGQVKQQMERIKLDMLRQEAAKLPQLVPAWSDSAKFTAAQQEIRQYIIATGADPEQVAGKYLDNAFAMATVWKAAQYDKLQKAKSEKVKQLRTAPPVVRPGATAAPVNPNAEQAQRARDRLRKSGDLRDAAAVILNRLK